MSIKVDLKIFIFLLLFLITNQSDIYLMILAFAIIHEIGHLIARTMPGTKSSKCKAYANAVFLYFSNRKRKNGQLNY